jgi:hypothetical protein
MRNRWFPISSTLLLWLCFGFRLEAQTAIYATFTAGKLNVAGTDWIYGGQAGIYHDFQPIPMLHLGLDGRAQILDKGQTKLISGMAGPRVAIKPWAIPIRPYVEALFGVGHVEFNPANVSSPDATSETDFEYQFVGGLDLTLFPHIDWRMGEFSYGGVSGLSQCLHPKTASTGLVVRF